MRGVYLRGKTFWYRFMFGGRQRRLSLQTRCEVQAVYFAQQIRDAPEKYLNAPALLAREIESFVRVKQAAGIGSRQVESYRHVLGNFLGDIGEQPAAKIDRHVVQEWFTRRLGNGSPESAIAYFKIVDRFFRWLLEQGQVRENPCAGIPVPRVKPRLRRRFLTREQARRLIDQCRDESLKFCLYCALHAGLRKGEIVEARPEWFDLDQGLLHVQATPNWHPKDRDNRTIPLTDEFIGFLRGYGLRHPYMLAPTVSKGKWRYRYDFRKTFRSHMDACGLHGFTFHDLRRTFASLLASSGVSILKIAHWLGDGVAVVEARYAHLMPNDPDINRSWTSPHTNDKKPPPSPSNSSRRAKRKASGSPSSPAVRG